MKTQILKSGLIAALACATTAALAQNPFVGTWKIDYAKSHLTGETFSLTPQPGGKILYKQASESYSFKPDGTDTKDSFGDTVQWKQINDHTWKEFTKEGPNVITDTMTLNNDDKTLEDATSGTQPNGHAIHETATFTRVEPGKGFYGKWKSTRLSHNSPASRHFEANGQDGILWNIPEMKASVALKFDGKEVTPTGPTVPKGLTVSATKEGPRSIEITERLNNKVIYRGRITISADGKTMTQVGHAPGEAPTRVVYQKA